MQHFPFPASSEMSTAEWTPKVNESKGCMTLGHSNWDIWNPQNLFLANSFWLFDKPHAPFPFSCIHWKGHSRMGIKSKWEQYPGRVVLYIDTMWYGVICGWLYISPCTLFVRKIGRSRKLKQLWNVTKIPSRLFAHGVLLIRVPQTVWFLVVVGILLILFGNMSIVGKLQHGNLPVNGLSTKLSQFPPLPEIRRFEGP